MQIDNYEHKEDYLFLKNSKLFKNLCDDALKELLNIATVGYWNKTDSIDPFLSTQRVFIIVSGRLKLLHVDIKTGRSVAIFILSRGDIYDFFTLLDGKEHDIEPVAIDKVKYISIPIEKVREWINKYPKFNEAFLPYIGEKFREIEEFSQSLVFYDTTTRLAKLILKHTHSCPNEDEEHYPVKLINNLTHETLAELIGSVRSVVTLQLKKLKQEGAIVKKNGKLIVSDIEKIIHKCDLFHKNSSKKL